MKEILNGAELVEHWRDGGDSPAGPLFAAGMFAEADITSSECGMTNCGTECTGSYTRYCC